MSEMFLDHISEDAPVSLQAGQRIVMKVVNADGTVAQVVFDDAVPMGEIFSGIVAYTGHLVSA